jgi:hypothetical protein
MRVNILNAFSNIHSSHKHQRYVFFQEQFTPIECNEKHFHRKSADLREFFRKHKTNWLGSNKENYTEWFSNEKWNSLPRSDQIKHIIGHCNKCTDRFPAEQNLFLHHDKKLIKKTNLPVPFSGQIEIPVISLSKLARLEYKIAAAKTFVSDANKAWENVYNAP